MFSGLRLSPISARLAGSFLILATLVGAPFASAQGAISFVQTNSATPQSPQTSVSVPYSAAQTAGDLNVVVVGWNDSTAQVSSVADTKGNTYVLAVGPTVQSGTATQAIYYAKNIAAATGGGNTVTVTFTAVANYPDIRIAEYKGLDLTSPLDVAVGAQGSSTSSSSGSITTTNANDLLVGTNLVQTGTTGAGTGFTSRIITPQDADILEDRTVTATGSYNATAPISPSAKWIMQMVAFRAAAAGPSITSISPTSGAIGASVTISGAGFGASQGTNTVTFNGTAAGTASIWTATSITVNVPAGATTGNVVVTVSGVASNGVAFTVAPSITSLNQSSGTVGTPITITGANFGASQGTSTVTFNGTAAGTATAWSATSITINVPSLATTGNVVVTVSSVASNGVAFSVTPSITSLSQSSAAVGTTITITGTGFGSTQGASTVTFNGTLAGTASTWTATSISAKVPAGATTGNVVVTVSGVASNGVAFTVAPGITSLNQSSGTIGSQVILTGTNFGASQNTSTVTFNGISAGTASIWTATSITVNVPAGATTGNVVVTVSGIASNGVAFTVGPSITSLNQSSGTIGSQVIITGTGFGASQSTSTVTFNGTSAGTASTWTTTSITVNVPAGATSGNVVVTVSSIASNGVAFTVAPSITSLSQSSGAVGTPITITGTGFGSPQGTSTVTFNGVSAGAATTWTATSITVNVPSTATSGNVVVTVGSFASNGVNFTVNLAPAISSLNQSSGTIGSQVILTGTNFGASQNTSTVTFNGISAGTASIWTATSITVNVPAGATTGNVVVTVSGIASNGVAFTVAPSITSLNQTSGAIGTAITITGTNFGSPQGTSTVTFNGVSAGAATTWTATSITVNVPATATSGNVVVSVGGLSSNGVNFVVTAFAPISLTQHVSKDAGTTTLSSLAFNSNNTAGNWIAVVVRAGRSNQVFTVSDSRGNTYRNAVQLNVTVDTPNGDTLAIFYAENIAGGANTVTVSDTINGSTLRFAIFEYSGVATSNSIDVTKSAQGTSSSPSTGNLTTTTSGDLLLGAIMSGNGDTYTAGAGYTIEERVPVSGAKVVAEDQIQAAAGTASASATLNTSDAWGAVLAASKPAGSGTSASPTITTLSPASGAVGTPVTISGTNFGASQGASTVTFNGTLAGSASVWSATSITVNVPTGATTGNVAVSVSGVGSSNGVGFTVTTPGTFTFIQSNSATPATSPTSVPVTYASAQLAGDLNVVIVGWNDSTATISSVADSSGNTYTLAVGPTVQTGTATQAIYYANNIVAAAASANTVTVTFASGAFHPDIRIAEYSGADPANPFDAGAAAQGNSVTSSSGSATTTNANDLLVAANTVQTATTGPGAGYTSRTITSDGDILEDQVVAATGSYTATAPVSPSGAWVMQIAAFRAASSGPPAPTAPSNLTASAASSSQINLAWGASTETGGTISSYLVERCQGATCSSFVQVATVTAPATSYNDTGLAASTSYSYRVRAKDATGNTGPYSNTATMTTLAATAPTAPTNLTATTFSNTQINLSWTASTETGGTISNYQIARCQGAGCSNFAQVGVSATTTFNDTGLLGSTTYVYEVRAVDNLNNVGPYSTTSSATTQAPTITAPSNLSATAASNTQINLSWTASTETGGSITNYLIERCQGSGCSTFAQVASVSAPAATYNDTGLVGNTSYSYRVRATDAGSNLSPYSNTATATTSAGVSTITFVQVNSATPHPSATSVAIPFTKAQAAGDLNVVVLGWNDSITQVSSVVDSKGNVYSLAVGPEVQTGIASQSIYYAANIAAASANGNTVTVTFNGSANAPDIRIAEYSGIDPAIPLDVVATAQGNSLTSDSGPAITTNANDLLVAGNLVASATTGPGTGFTNRVITSPDGDILEDRVVTNTGSYDGIAPVSPAGAWIMQMAAFRAAGSPPPPTISIQVSPSSASTPTGYGIQVFTATLQNDRLNKGVTWSISGAGCNGATCGALSNVTTTSVTYTAPPNLPTPATVTITATSVQDATKSGAATITVTQGVLDVSISPKRAGVTLSQTQQFTASVFNDPQNGGVTWSVDGNNGGSPASGTITVAGLYTPGTQPGSHTVTATSKSNSSISASVPIAVTDLAGVFMYHNDVQGTGQNTHEYALTPTNVNSSTFGMLFSCPVDGYLYADPLYVSNVNFSGQMHNVVIIATEHDSVYAFDADSPNCVQLWQRSFLSSGVTTVPPADTNELADLVPEIGITSTPVFDPSTNTIYVVPKTKETVGSGCSNGNPCYPQRLHALDLFTGNDKFGGPATITAPNFISLYHLQRAAIALNNGTVYVAMGSHGDNNVYQGWIMAYNAATLAQKWVYQTTDTAGGNNRGSIWQAGGQIAFDASGNLYVETANGTYDGITNWSDSVLKISPTGTRLDYFTPWDQLIMQQNDIDLGSSSTIILPDAVGSTINQHLAIATGKVGILYLLDQTNLGKYHMSGNQDVSETTVQFNTTNFDGVIYGPPAYWNGNVYVSTVGGTLNRYTIGNAVLATVANSTTSNVFPFRGTTPVVSSNGSTNGIVWILDDQANQWGGPVILYAYDALNLGNPLYASPTVGTGAAGAAVKFNIPAVANGKVYVPGQYSFTVYGLLPN